MDCFHQQAAGDVVSSRRCAVFPQVQAAGEMEDIFQCVESSGVDGEAMTDINSEG